MTSRCVMTVLVEGPSELGWRKWRCARTGCDRKTNWTPDDAANIHFGPCKGLPLANELGDWVRLFSEAFGLDHATAIVRYIRWRAKGSPLDELPPGVPAPNVAAPVLTHGLTPAELSELFPNEDPTLLGNRIKAMTDAIGIPACGGCAARAEWINKAHAWWRGQKK